MPPNSPSIVPDDDIPGQSISETDIDQVPQSDLPSEEDIYGTPGQQALTVLEGAGHGYAGPVATGIEKGLSKLGVPGLSPEEQEARARTNPGEHVASEIGGFGLGALTGSGEAAVLSKIGEGAAGLAGGAGIVSKIAQTGIKAGAELSALQAGDEISKTMNQDPNQTLGSAAINIGLSGIIGGAGGTVLGSVSPLFKTAANKLGVTKLATEFMGETKFLQDNPDLASGATKELSDRMSEAENMRNVFYEAKPELIAATVPEISSGNSAKIDGQLTDIGNKVSTRLAEAEGSIKTRAAVPYLTEDFQKWQQTITDPNANFADQFLATNNLKQAFASYARFGLTEEASAKGALGRELSNYIRPLLEDQNIWGNAGKIQSVTNDAISQAIDATNDLRGKLTSRLMGEKQIDPIKLQTFLNQAQKGKGGVKIDAVQNYLDSTQKWANAINKVHLDNGLEAPVQSILNATPILDHSLNTPLTPGKALAQWANQKGAQTLANAVGEVTAGGVGGIAGSLVGHPLLGAWAAEKILSPTLSVLAKPFAEKAIDSEAMRASVDYLANAVKGDQILSQSVKNLFQTGEVVPKYLVPDSASRDKLEKSIDYAQDQENAIRAGGKIGHYLPDHGTAAAALTAQATNYLSALKPKQIKTNPFDVLPPIDKGDRARYERALNVAQQPLMVLQYAKDGSLMPSDVLTLHTLLPGLHSSMVKKISDELVNQQTSRNAIPYSRRVSLSLLTGSPIDSTTTMASVQSIIRSAGIQQAAVAANQKAKKSGATEGQLKAMEKSEDLYATKLQAREIAKSQ